MQQDNIFQTYIDAVDKKNVKNSSSFKVLNKNNIDTNELTGHEKDVHAGEVNLNYKDDKEKEVESRSFAKGALAFIADMPEETIKALMMATLNGADVAANGVGTIFNAMTNVDPAMNAAFNNGDGEKFKTFLNKNIQDFSKYLDEGRDTVKNLSGNITGKGAELDSKAAEFVSMITQDVPYSMPIRKKLKSMGIPEYIALPVAFGIGSSIAFDDDASIFLNSEQVQGFKKMTGALPNTSEDKIFNTTFRMLEGTGLGFLTAPVIKALIFAKNNIPKYMNKNVEQISTAIGGAAIVGSVVDGNIDKNLETENPNILSEEKKTLNLGDQSSNQTMMEEFYGLDKTQLEKISEATGFPVDQLQSAGLQKIFTNPTLLKKAKEAIAPIFKSNVVKAVDKIPNTGSGNQVLGQIKNIPGVKESELKWIGLDNFLKNKKTVTKKEVSDFVNQNRIDVNEVKFGGKSQKFSQDIIEDIAALENKVAAKKGYQAAERINYDVYLYTRQLANNKEVSMTATDMTMDFAQLNEMLSGLPINKKNWFKDYLGKSGKVEIHKLTDNLNNRPVYVGKDLAETLIKEKELVRDIPAALNSPGTERYTRNRVLEFDALDIEKFGIEYEKRIFTSKHSTPKFKQYTEPGGEDYTELVFSIKKGGMEKGIPIEARKTFDMPGFGGSSGPVTKLTKGTSPFKGGHFGVKSEIAHVRFKTRDLNGLKVLTVEEMQSDFAIAAKRAKTQSGDPVTDFPFKNTWYELTVKRLIRYAADNGFDAVAIPKGSVAASRYGQKIEPVNRIEIQDLTGGIRIKIMDTEKTLAKDQKFKLTTFDKKDDYLDLKEVKKFKEIVNVINKQFKINFNADDYIKKLSAEMKKGEVGAKHLDDVVFKFDKPIMSGSGLGKYQLYDKAIPSFMKKYGKKWNAKVYDDKIQIDKETMGSYLGNISEDQAKGLPVTIIKLTPEMKKAVQEGGQSLFEILGTLGASGIAAKAVSDSKGNNTISNLTQ